MTRSRRVLIASLALATVMVGPAVPSFADDESSGPSIPSSEQEAETTPGPQQEQEPPAEPTEPEASSREPEPEIDRESPSDPGSVTSAAIEIDVPVANDDDYSVPTSGVLTVPAPGVLGNDTYPDGSQATYDSGPTYGSVNLNIDGGFTYTRTAILPLDDSFTYAITGPGGTSGIATVTLRGSPDLIAADDSYEVEQDSVLTVADPGVFTNDTGSGVASIQSFPTYGTLESTPNGGFTYTPDAGFHGIDTFQYQILHLFPYGVSNIATVTITVTPAREGGGGGGDGARRRRRRRRW